MALADDTPARALPGLPGTISSTLFGLGAGLWNLYEQISQARPAALAPVSAPHSAYAPPQHRQGAAHEAADEIQVSFHNTPDNVHVSGSVSGATLHIATGRGAPAQVKGALLKTSSSSVAAPNATSTPAAAHPQQAPAPQAKAPGIPKPSEKQMQQDFEKFRGDATGAMLSPLKRDDPTSPGDAINDFNGSATGQYMLSLPPGSKAWSDFHKYEGDVALDPRPSFWDGADEAEEALYGDLGYRRAPAKPPMKDLGHEKGYSKKVTTDPKGLKALDRKPDAPHDTHVAPAKPDPNKLKALDRKPDDKHPVLVIPGGGHPPPPHPDNLKKPHRKPVVPKSPYDGALVSQLDGGEACSTVPASDPNASMQAGDETSAPQRDGVILAAMPRDEIASKSSSSGAAPDPWNQKALQRNSKPQSNAAHGVNTAIHSPADSKPDAPPPWAQLPETPADAPKKVEFPTQIEKEWSKLWDDTYAEHDRALAVDKKTAPPLTETGFTVEKGMLSGELANTQKGGILRESGQFGAGKLPDWGYWKTGVFHLHDYPTKSISGSVDGADAASMVQRGDAFIAARSGTAKDGVNEYMFVRTAATKDLPANSQDETDTEKNNLMAQGMPFDQATRQAARDFAKNHDLVYYEGANGKFKRVYPP